MTKRKKINVKGIAKLDKKEMIDSKGAGCYVLFPDGQFFYCVSEFHNTQALDEEEPDVVVSHVFYY